MLLKLDDRVICEITVRREPGGVTYAVIRPDGTSPIFARRTYLIMDVAKVLRHALYEALETVAPQV